jgi:hypothetical protein
MTTTERQKAQSPGEAAAGKNERVMRDGRKDRRRERERVRMGVREWVREREKKSSTNDDDEAGEAGGAVAGGGGRAGGVGCAARRARPATRPLLHLSYTSLSLS